MQAPQSRGNLGLVGDRLLIVDDDTRLAEMLQSYLGQRGFVVDHAADGISGLESATKGGYDAIVLDVMMPRLDGFEVLKSLRALSQVPVLMLTARGDSEDQIVGLEIGADDYLSKPFNPRELLARIKAVLRRTRGASDPAAVIRFGRLELDTGAHQARLDGQPCDLTSHQFALLRVMADRVGRVLSRDQLMQLVRGEDLEAFDRSIDVHVSRIRAAIEDNPKQPRRILTVRGVGYVFAQTQP